MFLVAATACSSLRPVPEPMHYIAEQRPLFVHVSYVVNGIGRTVLLENPQVAGDSVKGTLNNRPITVPLRNIHSVSTMRFDGTRTAILAAAVTTTTGVVVYAIVQNSRGRSNWDCEYDDTVHFPNNQQCGFRAARSAP